MIVDTNIDLSRWPFRRLPGDDTPGLVARLRKKSVTQAWAGSFDALLHKDIGGVNARLAEECRTHGKNFLVPFGAVNPKLTGWQEDLRRCREEHKMPGIRLHPNYHQYALTDALFLQVLQMATEAKMVVQLALSMEDIRTQHPLVRVPPVDVAALPQVIDRVPGLRLVLLNWSASARGPRLKALTDTGKVWIDIATAEGVEGIARLVEQVPLERVLFGSHSPFFTIDAALFKMTESGLPEDKKNAILAGNAKALVR